MRWMQIQIKVIVTFLLIFGVQMYILFIIEVKVFCVH